MYLHRHRELGRLHIAITSAIGTPSAQKQRHETVVQEEEAAQHEKTYGLFAPHNRHEQDPHVFWVADPAAQKNNKRTGDELCGPNHSGRSIAPLHSGEPSEGTH